MKSRHHVPLLVRSFARMSTVCLIAGHAISAAELKYTLAPEAENSQLGSNTIAVGDLNDDGVPEIAVADQSYSAEGTIFASGIVYLLDGADGSLIRSYQGSRERFLNFGFSLATLNADDDGVPDLAVGSVGELDATGVAAGAVWIYSGADGSVISTTIGPAASAYGSSLANAGDQDGDGLDELFVGASRANGSQGAVVLQSSIDGSPIWSIGTDVSRSSFGTSVIALDDIDGDTLADFAVTAPDYRGANGESGRVLIYQSSDQQQVAEVFGTGYFGFSIAAVEDANEDGLRDLMVGSRYWGVCQLLSGSDLSLIADISIPTANLYQPLTAGGGFDADGDGISDWLLGSSGLTEVDGQIFGGVRIISGVDQSVLFSADGDAGFGKRLSVLPGLGIAIGDTIAQEPNTPPMDSVQLWEFEQFDEPDSIPDTDGDGVSDDIDVVINSDTSPTLVLLGVDSGVENFVDENGRTLADRFSRFTDPTNKRQAFRYLLRISFKAMVLQRRDIISRSDARAIGRAAFRGAISYIRNN
ncbi:integrin alpha [Haloferula sp.]|uniref:integrin alpha n=1 Tax=Haloferula sp. TaxID=2497595 RepID=UPI00329B9B34